MCHSSVPATCKARPQLDFEHTCGGLHEMRLAVCDVAVLRFAACGRTEEGKAISLCMQGPNWRQAGKKTTSPVERQAHIEWDAGLLGKREGLCFVQTHVPGPL